MDGNGSSGGRGNQGPGRPPAAPPQGVEDITDKTTVLKADSTVSLDLERAKKEPATLIVIRGPAQGQKFDLKQKEVVIGRDPAADISITDNSISRKHARFALAGQDQVSVTDLSSSNGTYVNGKKIEAGVAVILAKEDMVTVGSTVLKFLPAGAVETIYMGDLGTKGITDVLTGIFNKGHLLSALESEFKRARALHTDLSVVFMDLDFFKKVNDTYGHAAGDYVLKEFTKLVQGSYVRPRDVFARYGGEEFVLLLGNTPLEQAREISEKIRVAVEAHPFVFEGKKIPVTSSQGVARLTDATASHDDLMKRADEALYKAKQTGRNRVVVAD